MTTQATLFVAARIESIKAGTAVKFDVVAKHDYNAIGEFADGSAAYLANDGSTWPGTMIACESVAAARAALTG